MRRRKRLGNASLQFQLLSNNPELEDDQVLVNEDAKSGLKTQGTLGKYFGKPDPMWDLEQRRKLMKRLNTTNTTNQKERRENREII
jgi:hypothetical protein